MSAVFIKTGTNLIKTAIQQDNIKQYEEAVSLYNKGIQYLMTGMKYEKNPKVLKVIQEKVTKFIKRVETLKEMINNHDTTYIKKLSSESSSTPIHSNILTEIRKQSICLVFGFCRNNEKRLYTKYTPTEIIDLIFKYYHILPFEIINKSTIKWNDICGLQTAKMFLKEAIILPLKFPQLFTGKRKPWSCIMLYGPKGNGKSYLVKACATESECIIFQIYFSDLLSKYICFGDKIIKYVYDMARNSTQQSIILLQQIDYLDKANTYDDICNSDRENVRRIKTELLIQMGGYSEDNKNILTIGITDKPWNVDCAVRKRYSKRLYIKLPNKDERKEIFKIYVNACGIKNNLCDDDYDILSDKTNGLSRYEIYSMVKKIKCMELKIDDFVNIIDNVKISIDKQTLERYQKWTDDFGTEA